MSVSGKSLPRRDAGSDPAPGVIDRPRHPLRVFTGALLILLGVLFVFSFRYVALAALVGLMIGVLPEPMIRWLKERWRIPRAVGALLIGLGAVGVLAALGVGVYVTVVPQVEHLATQAPAIVERLNEYKETVLERFAGTGLNLEQLDVAAVAQTGMGLIVRGLSVGIEGLAGVIVVLMIGLFVAANYDTYGQGALTAFPPRHRAQVAMLGDGSVCVLRRWFGGQLVVVTISGILTALAMLLIGVDYWLLIAALTVILDFVPFIGAVITGTVAVALTLGTEPEKVIWVLLAFVAIQQFESNVILPIVLKETIRLPEAHLLVFAVILGGAFGILGIFVAPPLFAVLHYLYRKAYVPWIERRDTVPP